MKKLLVQEEAMIPALFYNLKRALIPLLDDSTYVTMQAVAASAEARGRNGKDRLPSKKKDQERNNEENRRKRSSVSEGMGTGPGLFGQNSNLTNGKNGQNMTHVTVVVNSDIGQMLDEKDFNESPSDPIRKKIKTDHLGIDDAVEGADDSDNDVHDDNNVCTSSYCPPCYELA